MKRRYVVIRPFKNDVLGNLTVGRVIKHRELKYVPRGDIEKNVFIQDYNQVVLPFNYGLIFLSTEFPHPEGGKEETREEMLERLMCEMKKCCCNSGKTFLENEECSDCEKCNCKN